MQLEIRRVAKRSIGDANVRGPPYRLRNFQLEFSTLLISCHGEPPRVATSL